MTQEVLDDAYIGYSEELAIFQKPIQNVGIKNNHITTFYPVNDFSTQGVIQFQINNNSSNYLDLRRTRLNITCKIVRQNGVSIEPVTVAKDSNSREKRAKDEESTDAAASTSTSADTSTKQATVGVVNNFMHSMFSRVDVALQNKVLTHSDESYPYLAYFKALLHTNTEMKNTTLQMGMFYKDTPGELGDPNWQLGDNKGLTKRSSFFANSNEVDMSGNLYCDILEIYKFIPNGVNLGITLYPSTPEFCLMAPELTAGGYKVQITRASLSVSMIEVIPEILVSHAEIMHNKQAIFPYIKTEVKKFTLGKGQFLCTVNDPFAGRVPCEMVCGLVTDVSNHGTLFTNPFMFEHTSLNFIQVTVDGHDLGQGPIIPSYNKTPETSSYIDAYKTLCGIEYGDHFNPLSHEEYMQGYTFYRFDADSQYISNNDDILPLKRTGNLRISLRFAAALPEPTTLIVFAKFPATVTIDKYRGVTDV